MSITRLCGNGMYKRVYSSPFASCCPHFRITRHLPTIDTPARVLLAWCVSWQVSPPHTAADEAVGRSVPVVGMPSEITDALTGVSSLSLAVAEWIINPRKVMLSELPASVSAFEIFLLVCPLFDRFGACFTFAR